MATQPPSATGTRRAEILACLAVAADAGMGHPSDLALRSSVLAVALANALKLETQVRSDAWNLSLLRFSGCTSEAQLAALAFGDEVKARGWLATADFGDPIDVLGHVVKNHHADQPALTRARMVARAFLRMAGLYEASRSHCEVAIALAAQLGFEPRFNAYISQIFERWDGKGIPKKLKKQAIAMPVRLACLAHDLELFHRVSGRDGAIEMAKQRRGSAHDPELVDCFLRESSAMLDLLDHPDPWAAALEAEPLPGLWFEGEKLDQALAALGQFSDLRCSFTRGHSAGVAALAAAAGQVLGLSADEIAVLRRAGHVHDLGRSAVSVSIWDKPGPLTATEREQVRLHSYLTERCLSRASSIARIVEVATRDHERLDGSGYHRGFAKPALDLSSRVLAAADCYHAMTEARPHRAALPASEAAAELNREIAAGRICPEAGRAVLSAAGHPVSRRALPGGMSEREVEVLGLLASGLSNKEMAQRLGISPKTVGHHVQHIYDKLNVSTRAAATMYAMQHDLVGR